MSRRVGQIQIQKAKSVNLIEFLQIHYPDCITKDKHCNSRYVHPMHDSLVIKESYFKHFSTGTGGDQIQFLMNYCEKDFIGAVLELCGEADIDNSIVLKGESDVERERNFIAPKSFSGRYARVWAYLTKKREIPADTVNALFKKKVLYQSEEYGNCVFLSDCCKYAEIHGTTDIKFKQIHAGSDEDGYWKYGDENANKVYVCESAIDAVSLYVLAKKLFPHRKIVCASVGGLKNKAINKILTNHENVILATDNDEKGSSFLENYKNVLKIKPPAVKINEGEITKDWNDILRYCKDDKLILSAIENEYYEEDIPF